jgi:HAD superfamily hydrolase (TIGR01509 family)
MPVQPRPYDLVIFDCDGVLVDSELLSAKVLMEQLADIGIDLSFDDFRQYFLGKKFAVAVAQLTERTQKKLPENFQSLYFEKLLSLFESELLPMTGVQHVLETMSIDFCVASSSIPPRLECALRVTELQSYFGSRVYSAAHVKNAKPAPDLFLHAAHVQRVAPERCLVIEDSEMGVMAANAAGMDVWHFIGGAHINAGHMLSDDLHVAKVVGDMAKLQELFAQIGLNSEARVAKQSGAHSYGA